MDFSAGLALAKGDYFIWFLVLVIMTIGICWQHSQRVLQDIVCEEQSKKTETDSEI
ncbi:hypothetical protein K8S19_12245 [bacterium]|nr:hypothetical protein [bacterium]